MPNITDIVNSIQIPQLIKDPIISQGIPIMDGRGRAIHYSGGFAVVFPFNVAGSKWAFRCWVSDLGNLERRLTVISERITALNLPYFCNFTYIPEGLVVSGKFYPTTRMQWIDGQNIKDYLFFHRNDEAKLLQLAARFKVMCDTLHKHGIAHGDLQHGNIMVSDNEQLYLIDYDSVFVPALKGESEIISGLADYQHPARNKNILANEKLDYFSELIIYTSIRAIAAKPDLALEYDIENNDKLLFCKEDYINIKSSKVYQQIGELGDEFKLLMIILEEYLNKDDICDLEPFEVLYDRYSTPPLIEEFMCAGGNNVYKGDVAHLTWKIDDYKTVCVNGKTFKRKDFYDLPLDNVGPFLLTLVANNGVKQSSSTLELNVFAPPEYKLKVSPKKLRRKKENKVTVSWNVSRAQSCKLLFDGNEISTKSSGTKELIIKQTSYVSLHVVGKDGTRVFTQQQQIHVLDESFVEFAADKIYSYPDLPVKLKWNIKKAKKVELEVDGKIEEVNFNGHKEFSPRQQTTYTLIVTDGFGQRRYEQTVFMLPWPRINLINVPTPSIENTINVQITPKVPDINVEFPNIKIMGLHFSPPQVPSLINGGMIIELNDYNSKKFSLWKELKSLFTHYTKYNKE